MSGNAMMAMKKKTALLLLYLFIASLIRWGVSQGEAAGISGKSWVYGGRFCHLTSALMDDESIAGDQPVLKLDGKGGNVDFPKPCNDGSVEASESPSLRAADYLQVRQRNSVNGH